MSKRAAKDAIKKIAKKEEKRESEIRAEMEKAIMIGFLEQGNKRYVGWFVCIRAVAKSEEFITVLSLKVMRR